MRGRGTDYDSSRVGIGVALRVKAGGRVRARAWLRVLTGMFESGFEFGALSNAQCCCSRIFCLLLFDASLGYSEGIYFARVSATNECHPTIVARCKHALICGAVLCSAA